MENDQYQNENENQKQNETPDFEKEPEAMNNQPEKKNNTSLFVLLAVLFTAIIVGGGVWWLKEKEMKMMENSKQGQILVQEKNVVENGKIQEEEKDNQEVQYNAINEDNRITLDQDNIKKYNNSGDCNRKFNISPSDEYVNYSSDKWGISFDVPYNKKWGDLQYRINPFEEFTYEDKKIIQFGNIYVFEGCSWARQYSIDFLPVKQADILVEELKGMEFVSNIFQEKSGEISLVKYKESGLCEQPIIQIIGKKYNYRLHPLCGGDFSELDKIVKTIKLY